ncbi:YceD family protein [Aliiruegeria sabulilitoris]|uniref:YceD family protein n=1 Tax=Aliiruegeria sabulilitoris TaxID=1510458 RepID=UPI00083621E3|nr:DUF177 domain-containing protein [Aliiruegeria sabulilitoris]NDR55017.1 DUF177 domain-containing protein [Pseudoruegeria sp. M32A2M]
MNATDNPTRFVLARLQTGEPTPFKLVPDAAGLDRLKQDLDLLSLRKVRLEGRLVPVGGRDWRLDAMLGATAVQPCSVTLAPVTTRIDTPVLRHYMAEFSNPTDSEVEMPEDDSIEPLPESVDLWDVLSEALAIALPDFPRAEGVELEESVFTEPGAEPLTEEAAKPFAGLAALKKTLEE